MNNIFRNHCRLKLWLSAICFFVSAVRADAVGPSTIAQSESQAWPESLNTKQNFDKASRASIIIYVTQLQKIRSLTDEEILAATKTKSVNRLSVDKWIENEIQGSLKNYSFASQSCDASDWTCLVAPVSIEKMSIRATQMNSQAPEKFSQWQSKIENFVQTYLTEQIRLAALFPRITSEIDTFSSTEWTGAKVEDRHFFLTFDDGPSNLGGMTDDTLSMLEQTHKSATFFVLGGNLQKRLTATSMEKIKQLYVKQCVSSHGWEHQSHASWDQWQDSILRTQTLIQQVLGNTPESNLFRPPYGQRKADSGDFFNLHHLKVALWNLDSQDWNNHMTADSVQSRIVTLMLIKRHGVILFHDIHGKAKTALPNVFESLGAGVVWNDCHDLMGIE